MLKYKLNSSIQDIEKILKNHEEITDVLEQISKQLARERYDLEQLLLLFKNMRYSPVSHIQNESLIYRQIAAELSKGKNVYDALQKVAKENDISLEVARGALYYAENKKGMLERYAKHYTAVRLKKRGFRAKEIAEIIGCSEKYVYTLIRNFKN